jgi:hypothetical protein
MVQAAAMLCSEISLLASALSLAKIFVQTTELFEAGDWDNGGFWEAWHPIKSRGKRGSWRRPMGPNRSIKMNRNPLFKHLHFQSTQTNLLLLILWLPMSSKSPRFGWLIAIFKKIGDYIAVNKNDYFVEVFTNQDLLKQKSDTKFPKSTISSR